MSWLNKEGENIMNKTTMDFLMEHGYKKVTADNIKGILAQGYVKGLHIEITSEDPFMLLARVKEKNAVVKYDRMDEDDPERIIIAKTDRFQTKLFNVQLADIKNMIVNIGYGMTDIIFNLLTDNNNYRILFVNNR